LHVMCAKKLSSEEAGRRNEGIEAVIQDEDVDDEGVLRVLRAQMTWKEWLRYDFFRYWFVLGAGTLNVFTCMEIGRAANGGSLILFILVILFVIMSLFEYLAYRRIWPHGILSGKESQKI